MKIHKKVKKYWADQRAERWPKKIGRRGAWYRRHVPHPEGGTVHVTKGRHQWG